MPELPGTSPVPVMFPQAQSSQIAAPAPTSLSPVSKNPFSTESSKPSAKSKKHVFPLPKLRLEIRDLNHTGTQAFLTSVVASEAMATSVQSVLSLLYHSPDTQTTTVPPTRSVTLILRPMEGVAYTTGSDLDSDHKEIHFSLDYIHRISAERKAREILGVLTHEMVHCYQYDAFGTCPGGLIEGIADWVRLNADLSPPHWKRETTGNWDAGYQHTGYFLEYLEQRFGRGTVRRINEKLRISKYQDKRFWTECCGRPVEQLWSDYGEAMKKEQQKVEDEEPVLVEKEDAKDQDILEPTPSKKAESP